LPCPNCAAQIEALAKTRRVNFKKVVLVVDMGKCCRRPLVAAGPADSLKLGRPLDAGGGGGWDRERILAGAAALYSASENSQSRLQLPLEAIKAHSTMEHEKSRRAKVQLAQAAQQFGRLSQFAIAG
jgi:hypothetical protein